VLFNYAAVSLGLLIRDGVTGHDRRGAPSGAARAGALSLCAGWPCTSLQYLSTSARCACARGHVCWRALRIRMLAYTRAVVPYRPTCGWRRLTASIGRLPGLSLAVRGVPACGADAVAPAMPAVLESRARCPRQYTQRPVGRCSGYRSGTRFTYVIGDQTATSFPYPACRRIRLSGRIPVPAWRQYWDGAPDGRAKPSLRTAELSIPRRRRHAYTTP